MRSRGGLDWGATSRLLALALVALLLWDTPLVAPLRLLVVFFHELSHGLAALMTGGEIVRIEVVASEGGLCITRGGSRFFTLSAGYLGSLLLGGAILLAATRTRLDRALSVALGAVLLGVTLAWVRPIGSFGFGFGLLAGALLILAGRRLAHEANETILCLIGLISCLYAVFDIKSDVLDRPQLASDAVLLGELTGVPGLLWGLLWLVIACLGTAGFLVLASRRPGRPPRAAG